MLFQSTPSTRRETGGKVPKLRRFHISIHSLHTEGDGNTHLRNILPVHFNPLPPHGGRLRRTGIQNRAEHFNPLPPHGGRLRGEGVRLWTGQFQSTPSTRRETVRQPLRYIPAAISIHSLRMEGDGICNAHCLFAAVFQSTPSAWRETEWISTGEAHLIISIHSLRMEGDRFDAAYHLQFAYFNPLPPHGGRPFHSGHHRIHTGISIHSLRMEGDVETVSGGAAGRLFQSTPSAWRETALARVIYPPPISIHSLRMEGDREISRIVIRSRYFNPLPPHGGRQRNDFSDIYHSHISIHSLRMEGDQGNSADYRGIMEFQSTPSAWRET